MVGGNGGDIGDIRGGEAINRISCMGSNLLDADNDDEWANVLANWNGLSSSVHLQKINYSSRKWITLYNPKIYTLPGMPDQHNLFSWLIAGGPK